MQGGSCKELAETVNPGQDLSSLVLLRKVVLLSMRCLVCVSGYDCSGSSYRSLLTQLHKSQCSSQNKLPSNLLLLNIGLFLWLQDANQ